jgi:hypothetical protein
MDRWMIIEHVKQLPELAQSHLVLLHVADGWAETLPNLTQLSVPIVVPTGSRVRLGLVGKRNYTVDASS